MKLEPNMILGEKDLAQLNQSLNRNYSRAEVVWVDSDDKPHAMVRVTDGRGQTSVITVPAELEG